MRVFSAYRFKFIDRPPSEKARASHLPPPFFLGGSQVRTYMKMEFPDSFLSIFDTKRLFDSFALDHYPA